MKSETVAYFAKSREFLNKARELFDAHHWPDEAGRAAYLAGLHAAHALIFDVPARSSSGIAGCSGSLHSW